MIIFKIIFRWTSSPNTWFVIDPNWFPIPKNVLRTSTSKWLRPKMLIIVINAPLSPLSNLDISNVLDPTARKCGPGKKSILVLSFHGKFWNIFFHFKIFPLYTIYFRTSETRFIACGSRGKMVLQSIINQGELNAQLFGKKVPKFVGTNVGLQNHYFWIFHYVFSGMKTERVVTGTLQTLRLVEVKTQAPKPLPQALTPLRTMMYEYR